MTDPQSLVAVRTHMIQVRKQASHNYDPATDPQVQELDALIAAKAAPKPKSAPEPEPDDVAAKPSVEAVQKKRPTKGSATP